jgi:hypothetical protein
MKILKKWLKLNTIEKLKICWRCIWIIPTFIALIIFCGIIMIFDLSIKSFKEAYSKFI